MIADRALTTPTNTQHLMELKEAMIKAEEKDLPLLEEEMIKARHRCVKHKDTCKSKNVHGLCM